MPKTASCILSHLAAVDGEPVQRDAHLDGHLGQRRLQHLLASEGSQTKQRNTLRRVLQAGFLHVAPSRCLRWAPLHTDAAICCCARNLQVLSLLCSAPRLRHCPTAKVRGSNAVIAISARLCEVNVLVGEIEQVLVPGRPHEPRRVPILSPQTMHRLRPKHRT